MTTANLASSNPYFFGPPIRSRESFHGRSEEIKLLKQCIANNCCVAVVGERRIGKTSLLLHLQSEPLESWPGNVTPLIVFIDAQLSMSGENDFYARAIRGLSQRSPIIRELLPRLSQKNEQDLIYCLEQIAPQRLTLLIDEFEMICGKPVFSEQFFITLRAITQGYGLSLVTTTSKPLGECCTTGNASSVFRNVFQDIRLGPFSEQETRRFVETTSQHSGVALTRYLPQIVELGGHFPAFLQIACSCYYEVAARQTRLTPQDHQDIRQQFAYKTGSLFESIWQQYLNDNEKQALLQLISGQVVDRSMVSELARKGYVVGKRVFSAPFAEMLLQEKSANTWTMHLDEQGELWLNGNKLNPPLTKSQHHLLTYLYENSERVCEKDEIANSVWGSANMDKIDDERIAKLVSRLRERIEPDPDKPRYLLTAHGRGYRLMRQQKEAERKE